MANLFDVSKNITDISNSYALCNHYMMECYNAIHPSYSAKLSLIIFTRIISNKQYYLKSDKTMPPEAKEREKRRIYNSLPIDSRFLLYQSNPYKFNNADNLSSDISNMQRKIAYLTDNNIFYLWKFGTPHKFIFFMERNFAVWKTFNPLAVVPGSSLLKILKNGRNAIKDAHIQYDGGIKIEDLEKSFYSFIMDLFGKLSENLRNDLSACIFDGNIYNYIDSLINILESKENMDSSFKVDESFTKRIPMSVRDSIESNIKNVLNSITPKDGGSIIKEKIKRSSVNKPKNDSSDGISPTFLFFEADDPTKNVNSFINYYKSVVKSLRPEASFYSVSHQRNYAAQILDFLNAENKCTKIFIKNWAEYFANKNLGGRKALEKENTSLKVFMSSYSDYVNRSFA